MKANQKTDQNCWNILIADDREDLHTITINAFFDEVVDEKKLNFLSAYTEGEAKDYLDKYHAEIAVVILDMVMGHNGDEGLNILSHLINNLGNNKTQVLLRTGYPGKDSVKITENNYPQVVILEKGETNVETLILLVSEAIMKYHNYYL